jgi:ribonucleoside-triphosphate reductase
MTDRKNIERRLAELRGELASTEGTPTEVYSRIVGYYRSVRNWNAGKREEYGQRLPFAFPAGEAMRSASEARVLSAAPMAQPEAVVSAAPTPGSAANLRKGILVFTREACPNCPPVKNYVVESGMKAVFVDVDKEAGFALARDLGVLATPTVLGLDADGREAFRAFDVKGLRTKLAQAAL